MSKAKTTDTQSRPRQGADRHDLIRVHARVNNLKDVSVEIPKRRLTVFTGLSGSGKSSLVFGTIAAESQRLINETYSTFVQGFMPNAGASGRRRVGRADDGDPRRPGADGRQPPTGGRWEKSAATTTTTNNLRDVERRHPARRPGASSRASPDRGKAPPYRGSVSGRDGVCCVDRPGRGSRARAWSNPATYTGLLDPIRKAFAKANGVKPALFSANS